MQRKTKIVRGSEIKLSEIRITNPEKRWKSACRKYLNIENKSNSNTTLNVIYSKQVITVIYNKMQINFNLYA